MTIDDIEPVLMGAADAGVAAIAGQVPAAVTYEPYITTALGENRHLQAALHRRRRSPGLIGDVFVVQNEYARGASRPGPRAAPGVG